VVLVGGNGYARGGGESGTSGTFSVSELTARGNDCASIDATVETDGATTAGGPIKEAEIQPAGSAVLRQEQGRGPLAVLAAEVV
jgi:hypothetical protein